VTAHRQPVARELDHRTSSRPRVAEQVAGSRLQLILSAACAYTILSILSRQGLQHHNGTVDIWLPCGLSDALALRVGLWAVPITLLGGLIDNLGHGGHHLGRAVIVAIGHGSSCALVAALAPRWMRGRDLFASLSNLFVFLGVLALAALASTVIASLVIPELRDWNQQGPALSWWAGNLTGSVVLAPPLLSWMGRNSQNQRRELLRTEYGLLLLACGLTALVVSADWIQVISLRPATLVMPLSLWAAYRFSPAAATPVTGLLALSLSWLPNPNDQRLLSANALQSQEVLALTVNVALITALTVLVINNSRVRTSRQLRQLAGSLERTVAERTDQLAAANARLQHLSDTDGLTGIANRRRFDGLLSERWRMAAASGTPLAVAMIDIDHFKAYNDTYGHPAGDRCLQQVAAALSEEIRQGSDCLARYGGEEFVVLWNGLDPKQAAAMAERLRACVLALALPHQSNGAAAVVTLSIGVAAQQVPRGSLRAPSDEIQHGIDALLKLADQRLYAAKSQGRNRVVST